MLTVCRESECLNPDGLESNMEKNADTTTDSSSIRDGRQDDVDKAYEFAKQHEVGPLSADDNKRILKKIDRNLLPLVITNHPYPYDSALLTNNS